MARHEDKGEHRKDGSMHAELLAAIDRVCRTDGSATITAVAREVGVTPALIHNRYPDVASTIRGLAGRTQARRDGGSEARVGDSRPHACWHIAFTKDYLQAFEKALSAAKTSAELVNAIAR